ncbi:MAG: methyltransferase domain-containing protein [Acidobacteria bacterium]|nr:methyltransferase domain-containing protein [Acidobacteriota bacterium]
MRGFILFSLLLICHPDGAAQETISKVLAPVYPPLAEQIVKEFDLKEKRGTGIDIGSGPGDLIIELCKRTRWMHWVNADIDSKRFAGFLQRAEEAGVRGRVSAILANVQALPFHDAFAEVIVSRGSFPFWKDKRKGLSEIYRVLKPGGVAFIGRGFSDNLPIEVARQVRERQRRNGKEPVYDVEKTAAELRQIMRSLKVEDYRIRVPRRGDVNYGIWLEFHKPARRGPPSLLERPTRESAGLDLSTTVVEKSEIEEQGAQTLVDALRFVPGAWIESRGRKVKEFVSFRGQKYPYPEYAIDGVLFREFVEVPYFLSSGEIERVEVMRSGAAMLAGNAGLVGLINVVPRRYEARETSVKLEYGSLGTADARISHGGRVGNFSYALGFDGYRTDGPANRHGEERIQNFFGGLTWTPSESLSMSMNAFHIEGSRGMVQALPPATKALQSALEKFDPVQSTTGTLNTLYRPNQRLSTQLLLGYSDRHNRALATTANGTTTTRDWDRELTTDVVQSFALTASNALKVGANFNHWVAPYGKRFYTGRRCDLETYSLALTDEQRLGALVVDGSVRYQRTYIKEYGAYNIEETATAYRSVPPIRNQWDSPMWSASLGAGYYVTSRLSINGNLLGGTVEPRPGTLDTSLLPPKREERMVADLGFRLSDPQFGTATVSGFFVRRGNGINLNGQVMTVNGRLMELYENRDQDSRGVEIDLRSRRVRNTLQVFLNVTAMTARIRTGSDMQSDSEIPHAIAGGGLLASRWGCDLGLFWKAVSSYESSRFAAGAIFQPLGGFQDLGLTLARRFGARRHTRVYAEVNNVADTAYSTVVGYPDYGRRARVGVERAF